MYSGTSEVNNSKKNSDIKTDESIIENILAGNLHSFELIMRRYNQRLYRVAYSVLGDADAAQDAVQQAYIKAYFKLDTYVKTKSFSAWITKITLNEALMIKRKPDNRDTEMNHDIDQEFSAEKTDDPANIGANKELTLLIESAINKLPDDFRHVFVLRAIQSLSVKEISECLEIKESTVKTRYHRARNLMQQNLNVHIEQAGLQVFEFAGKRCDNIVNSVLNKIISETNNKRKHISFH